MAKYKKKPVVIEAVQWRGDNLVEVKDFCLDDAVYDDFNRAFKVDTLEGRMIAKLGDWIIKGVKGEHYPCKPDIFEKTYEEVK